MNRYEVERTINMAIGTAASLLSLYIVARMAFGPDVFTRVKMRGYLVVSHAAKRGADICVTVAGNADTAYHRARNVTV